MITKDCLKFLGKYGGMFAIALLLTVASVMPALAHHPEISAEEECLSEEGVVEITATATAWEDSTADARVNNDVRLYYKVGTGSWTEFESGHFGADNGYTFQGTFQLPGDLDEDVKVKAVAIPKWGVNEDRNGENTYRETTIELDGDCVKEVTVLCGTGVVDGNVSEWVEERFLANMHRAGKGDKDILSKFYGVYNPSDGHFYGAVIVENGVTPEEDDDDAFVKVDASKVVDGSYAAAFFMYTGTGFEFKFPIAEGIYEFDVHLNVNDGEESGQTSALAGRKLTVKIDCPEVPKSTVKIVKTVINDDDGTLGPEDFEFFAGAKPAEHNVAVEVEPGEIQLSEQPEPGYHQVGGWGGDCSADGKVTVGEGEHKTCTITNDDDETKSPVTVCKFNDLDGDGEKDPEEPLLQGWTIWHDANDNGVKDDGEVHKLTGEGGCTSFEVEYGSHDFCEKLQDGWTNTTPLCQSGESSAKVPSTIYFGNKEVEEPGPGKIKACKYMDADKDDEKDDNEGWLQGVTMNLYEKGSTEVIDTGVTGENGCVEFDELEAGKEFTVCEVVPSGQQPTGPICRDATVVSEETTVVKFGNFKEPTALPPNQQPGSSFIYMPSLSNN